MGVVLHDFGFEGSVEEICQEWNEWYSSLSEEARAEFDNEMAS